jgi:protein tyrosine/serine phosphatase
MKKIFLRIIIIIILLFASYKLWNKYINYNFGTITANKVYKSGAIDPKKIKEFIEENNIKTVIDLRDTIGQEQGIKEERRAVDGIEGVKYVNIKSPQVPTQENLKEFFNIMDKKDSYPVLIHCYHGLGRTMLFSALYRIEYENMSNEKARLMTRPFQPNEFLFYKSSFAQGRDKGDFLINYKKRIDNN